MLIPNCDRVYDPCRAQERLAEQRAQADADPGYDSTFKGPRSKAEKKEKRKAILAAIGAQQSCRCCGVAQPATHGSRVRICTHTHRCQP